MDENNQQVNVDKMSADEITEALFKAIDAIVIDRIKQINYDQYIVATITDATNAMYGEYTVTTENGNIFIAYSERTDLFNEIKVYVRIPGGDYSRRKVITELYEPLIIQQQNENIEDSVALLEQATMDFIKDYRNILMNVNLSAENQQKEIINLINQYNSNRLRIQTDTGIILDDANTVLAKNNLILDYSEDIVKDLSNLINNYENQYLAHTIVISAYQQRLEATLTEYIDSYPFLIDNFEAIMQKAFQQLLIHQIDYQKQVLINNTNLQYIVFSNNISTLISDFYQHYDDFHLSMSQKTIDTLNDVKVFFTDTIQSKIDKLQKTFYIGDISTTEYKKQYQKILQECQNYIINFE